MLQKRTLKPAQISEKLLLPPPVRPGRRNELYADVEVVTRQDLEKTTATTLENALRGLPGWTTEDQAPKLVVHHQYSRIGGGKRSLLMMDGVPLNSALTGFAYPLRTDLFSVEQVEVVKGSFSSYTAVTPWAVS